MSTTSSATTVPTARAWLDLTAPSAVTVTAPLEPLADWSVRAYVARSWRHLRPSVYSIDDAVPGVAVRMLPA